MSDVETIVIDLGSGVLKSGFAGDDAPRCVIPNIVGKPKHAMTMVGCGNKQTYIGDEANSQRAILKLFHPIQRGMVNDWDHFESLMHFVFYNELRCAPEEHPVLLTSPPMNPKGNSEKTTQIMFETFSVPAMYIAMDSVLSLFSSGRTSGCVVNVGEGVTSIVPINSGYCQRSAIKRLDLAGSDITQYLNRMLTERGYLFTSTAETQSVQDIKKKLCYTSMNYEEDCKKSSQTIANEKEYELVDGNTVIVDSERFRAPELLFKPSLNGFEEKGLHELVYDTIMSCEIDTRRDLYSNVVLSGGSTLFEDFGNRLHQELSFLAPTQTKVSIISSPERSLSSWIGGSILASLSSFQRLWISKENYDEHGPNVINNLKLT